MFIFLITDEDMTLDESASDATIFCGYRSELNGITVSLHSDKSKGIAFQLWPAATILCQYMEENPNVFTSYFDSRTHKDTESASKFDVLELGIVTDMTVDVDL